MFEALRPSNEIEARAIRSKLYQSLRSKIEKSCKKSEIVDDFDDLLGSSSAPRSVKTTGNPKQVMQKLNQFIQKLVLIGPSNKDVLIETLGSVNLVNVMPEVIQNLINADFNKDCIVPYVHIVTEISIQYPEFWAQFEPPFLQKMNTSEKKYILIRIYGDFLILGLVKDERALKNALDLMINSDLSDKSFTNHKHIWALCSYSGGDLFGVDRGSNSVIDPVFPKRCVAPKLRDSLFAYYKGLVDYLKELCAEGKVSFEQAYEKLIKYGTLKTAVYSKANDLKKRYTEMASIADHYQFLINKQYKKEWEEDEEYVDFALITGENVRIPKRIFIQIDPHVAATKFDPFYDKLADFTTVQALKIIDPKLLVYNIGNDKSAQNIDKLSKSYVEIDNPENRIIVKGLFSTISKGNPEIAPHLARFVANVSQVFPEIGNEIAEILKNHLVSHINKVNQDSSKKGEIKIHYARYIGELARFRIGIDSYFDLLKTCMFKLSVRIVDIICVLMNSAASYMDSLSGESHSRINNIVEELESKKVKFVNYPGAVIMINQAISTVKPIETTLTEKRVNPYNVYQAFLIHYIRCCCQHSTFDTSGARYINKLLALPKFGVTQEFVLQILLNLTCFSEKDYSKLAQLLKELSKTHFSLVQTFTEVLYERVHRYIDSNGKKFKHQANIESRFLAELCVVDLIDIDSIKEIIISFIGSRMNRTIILIGIQKPGRTREPLVKAVYHNIIVGINMISIILPKLQRNYMIAHGIMVYLQATILSLPEIPPKLNERVSYLFDQINDHYQRFEGIVQFDSKESIKKYLSNITDSNSLLTKYDFVLKQKSMQKTGLQIPGIGDSSDDECEIDYGLNQEFASFLDEKIEEDKLKYRSNEDTIFKHDSFSKIPENEQSTTNHFVIRVGEKGIISLDGFNFQKQ